MAVRAMWKAVLRIGELRVPVKMYSALQDRDVHFRLLHRKDHAPVRQQLVNPRTDEVVEYDAVRRGYFTPDGDLVMFKTSELEALEPDASREIELLSFLPPSAIDHRWYRRSYYLGPDEDNKQYAALVQALDESGREGLARWVMRKKAYVGALRLHQGYLMLVALRHTEEIVALDSLDVPSGRDLDERELAMAQQLIGMLASEFKPEEFSDHYRKRLLQFIKAKAAGGKVALLEARSQAAATDDLSKALEASLQQERKRA